MSSRTSKQSVSAVLEAVDQRPDSTTELAVQVEEATATEDTIVGIDGDGEFGYAHATGEANQTTSLACESEQPAAPVDDFDNDVEHHEPADMLAQQLDQLVRSVSVVEELSRRAREAATSDL